MSQQQYGLVLSGGGAKGAFEMGVWKALRECDYSLGAVIGTSVGALNAAMIAQDDYEMAMAFWSNLTINQVLDLNKKITNTYVEQWSKENFDVFRDGFLTILFSDGLDISPLRHNLTQLICEEKIRNSPIRFGLVTVDITSLKPCQLMIEDIPEGQLIDYLLASAALPIFQKQEIDGKTRTYLALPENLAPVKIIVAPLLRNKPQLVEKAREVYAELRAKYDNVSFDDSGKIGKVYAKADEIGVPKVVVIDFDTIENDGLVSVRNRDDASQIRIKPGEI